ncbi:MAG: MltA domain-containing protein [Thermodesulfovibrionia bacterium]|nr:MltA domain-containing protein [Thermodesulfovibrionia bacterium]
MKKSPVDDMVESRPTGCSSIKINFFFICISSFIFISTLNSCSLFVKPPTEPTLEQLPFDEVNSFVWEDDMNYEGLSQAVEQSILYYQQLPATESFHYKGLIYSPEEMEASLKLFMKIVTNFQGEERMSRLRETFLFFESKNTSEEAFFTGYYEPLIEGSTEPTQEFRAPLYTTPEDLIKVDLGQFREEWKDERIIGRLEGNLLIPYDSREEIAYEASLKKRANVIAYVNEIELFFLQIQGSGLIRFPDGRVKRVNYANQNGYPYRSIGGILKDRIPEEEMSMQTIKAFLYSNPEEVREILSYNQSYIFFRETAEGPLGAIEVPLTPHRSLAMDRRVVPRGGLAFIETELPVFENGEITGWKPVKRFVLVQDTGGAIRGHGRVDLFFGNGDSAGLSAGSLKQRGRCFLIVARKEFLE